MQSKIHAVISSTFEVGWGDGGLIREGGLFKTGTCPLLVNNVIVRTHGNDSKKPKNQEQNIT